MSNYNYRKNYSNNKNSSSSASSQSSNSQSSDSQSQRDLAEQGYVKKKDVTVIKINSLLLI
ncbi:hypothetical protein [Bacillus sp. TH25]|uniref:hypothetical protein n=1 Tax=Bacillus sp. TH25 TaxID=2796391 RepID=UPI001912AC20|nr:hypothetical protein [Bacillus sp. TH25]MBK5432543.1 hypothetical protein [Bacillus sp. TH25]